MKRHEHTAFTRRDCVRQKQVRPMRVCVRARVFALTLRLIPLILFVHFGDKIVVAV